MKKQLVLAFVLVISTLFRAGAQNKYEYRVPKVSDDGWKTASLISKAIDTSRFHLLFNQLQSTPHKMHSFLLIKDSTLLLEEYFNDQDRDTQHDLRSVTKSIRSLLLGIALDKGYIESIDDPIFKYLKTHSAKKNLDPRKEQITIRHLITMSSGFDCNDWDKNSAGQEDKVYRKKDWIQFTLDLPMINDPGAVANYCSMGSIIMAEIVSQASGMPIEEFGAKYLFEPLGITKLSWGHTSKKEVIPSSKRLYMTARDMGKIGQLLLNKGRWGDVQIVSAQWIEESSTEQSKITGMAYGYHWWRIPFRLHNLQTTATVATGNGGQYIMIFEELDVVAVFTGGAYNSEDDKLPFAIVKDIILPSVTKNE